MSECSCEHDSREKECVSELVNVKVSVYKTVRDSVCVCASRWGARKKDHVRVEGRGRFFNNAKDFRPPDCQCPEGIGSIGSIGSSGSSRSL